MSLGTPLGEMNFDEYVRTASNPRILTAISSIAAFSFTAEVGSIGRWPEKVNPLFRLHLCTMLQDAIKLAGFHRPSSLTYLQADDGVKLEYEDEEYGFSFSVSGSGRIALCRGVVTNEGFHEWYRRLMPSLPSLINGTVELIARHLLRVPSTDDEPVLNKSKNRRSLVNVERAEFKFTVKVDVVSNAEGALALISSFRSLGRNQLPGEQARPASGGQPDNDDQEDSIVFERHDYRRGERVRRSAAVRIDPASKRNRLTFNFVYAGEAYTPVGGERVPFNSDQFVNLHHTEKAYIEFFRERSICSFVGEVILRENDIAEVSTTQSRLDVVTRPVPPSNRAEFIERLRR